MRLADLCRPHLDGVRRIVDAAGSSLPIEQWLAVPAGIEFEVAPPEATGPEVTEPGPAGPETAAPDWPLRRYAAGDLVVVADGPARAGYGPPAAVAAALRGLEVGARLLVLRPEAAPELGYAGLLDSLCAAGCQVRQVAGIDSRLVRTAILAERVAQPAPPLSYVGVPVPGADDTSLLRVLNEHAFGGYVARADRARLRRLEDELAATRVPDNDAGLRDKLTRAQEQAGQLSAALRSAEERLRQSERRLRMLESSTSLHLGQALVTAARDPRRTPQAARQLVGTWRSRAAQRGAAATAAGQRDAAAAGRAAAPAASAATEPALAGDPRRHFLLGHQILADPRDLLAVAGVLREVTAAALAPDCALTMLAPHDAGLLVERTRPDLLLIEAAAGRPGESWAYLGSPYAVDRDRALLDAMAMARAERCQVVLWWNVPYAEAPWLARLADLCDVVVSGDGGPTGRPAWSRGVQLAVHNPIGATSHPTSPTPAEAEPRDAVDWRRTAEVYRQAASVVAAPYASADPSAAGAGRLGDGLLEALACGARVVVEGAVPPAFDGAVCPGAADAVPEAPLDTAVRRRVLRTLATGWSTRAQLARLAELAGVPVPPRPADAVTVLATVTNAAEAEELLGDLLRQQAPPGELVLAAAPELAVDIAAELPAVSGDGSGDAGGAIPLRWLPAAATPAELVSAATCGWLVPWSPRGWPETYLLDLLLGARVSGADAVGFRPGPDLAFVQTLPLRDCAVRRSTAHTLGLPAGGRLDGWVTRGARLFALASDLEAADR